MKTQKRPVGADVYECEACGVAFRASQARQVCDDLYRLYRDHVLVGIVEGEQSEHARCAACADE